MINFRFIANLMGRLLLIESAFLLLCVLIALIYGQKRRLFHGNDGMDHLLPFR